MAQPEEARCSRRDAKQLLSPVPRNGPRVSSSGKLARRCEYAGSDIRC
jgi:hypothetical protein